VIISKARKQLIKYLKERMLLKVVLHTIFKCLMFLHGGLEQPCKPFIISIGYLLSKSDIFSMFSSSTVISCSFSITSALNTFYFLHSSDGILDKKRSLAFFSESPFKFLTANFSKPLTNTDVLIHTCRYYFSYRSLLILFTNAFSSF
jgi:hypothetical protein